MLRVLRSLIGNGVERRALEWEIGRDPCRFGRAHGGAERRALPYSAADRNPRP